MILPRDDRGAEMRALFLESAVELLQALNDDALKLESQAWDVETVRSIRRHVHTLKGDAAAVGFHEISELAHELEDVLSPEATRFEATELAQVILSAADMFDAMLAAYRGGVEPPSGDPLRAMIAKLAVPPPGRATPDAGAIALAPAHRILPSGRRTSDPGNSLRVDVARLDAILDLVGEMMVAKSVLQQAVSEFSRLHPKDALGSRLSDGLALQSQALSALQRAALQLRMVPAQQLFRRFPRLVRGVAQTCGKRAQFETVGEDTEFDKVLLDALAEPLAHLLRNAISHGIESPVEREAAGKPETGSVRLNAFQRANQVVIEVSDDGRGIDSRQVLTRAIQRGLVSPEAASRLSRNELLEFIFEPGFSTATEITPIAGRGVGLDIVRNAVHRLKGTVSVETQPGQGTTFRIRLPLTLAILRGMMFRVRDRLYAVPLESIVQLRRVRECEITRAGNHEVMPLRDELITIVRLRRLECEEPIDPAARLSVLIVNVGTRRFGLVVDALMGEQELVIKPVDEKVAVSGCVSGASVLGDGSVAFVLNLAEVVRRLSIAAPQMPPAPPDKSLGATV